MDFKDTKYGDLTGETYYERIKVSKYELKTLKGSPKIVTGDFDCSNNQLISLKYRPLQIDGDFDCSDNKLETLKYRPIVINGDFFCYEKNLKNLEGSPKKVGGNFFCQHNKLTSLKGSPLEVGSSFNCFTNNLKTLEGRPKIIKDIFNCKKNPELKNIKAQIIKYQIKAKSYETDEGSFTFEEIKEEFEKYEIFLLKQIQIKHRKDKILNTKKILNNLDYGLGM